MKNFKITLTLFLALIYCLSLSAQTIVFDEKIDLGNGLFKVKTNNRWGIVDADDRTILSIEYNEPKFFNGKAVLCKYGTMQIAGIIDMDGHFTATPPYYLSLDHPIVSDGMLVVREKPDGKWGFLNTANNELVKVNIKAPKSEDNVLKKFFSGKGDKVKGSFVFDYVAPFVEGFAVVYTDKTGWHHIDKNGNERFINLGLPTLFRTSVHNGRVIIIDTNRGVVLCDEGSANQASVLQYVDGGNYELKNYSEGLHYPYVIENNGSKLTLNIKFQAEKYEKSNGDSIIFIERPKPVQKVEEPVDSFTLDRDISVSLSKKNVSAGAKGTAPVTVNVENVGEFDSKNISVTVNVNGTKKTWDVAIDAGETKQLTLHVAAKFSSATISRDVEWNVTCGDEEIVGSDKVTIYRYKPSRR